MWQGFQASGVGKPAAISEPTPGTCAINRKLFSEQGPSELQDQCYTHTHTHTITQCVQQESARSGDLKRGHVPEIEMLSHRLGD